MLPPVAAKPARVRVVEGAYCLHPDLADRYDLKVFVRASLGERRARLLRREGEAGLRRFEHEWIPLEDLYFDAFQIERLCDFVVDSEPVRAE